MAPRALMDDLKRLDPSWTTRQGHVCLYRLCLRHLSEVRELVRHDQGRGQAAALQDLLDKVGPRPSWPLLLDYLWRSLNTPLTGCVAALQVLDGFHAAPENLEQFAGLVVELPGAIPLRTLFSVAAANPINTLLDEAGLSLERPTTYYEERLDYWLDLKFRLVLLETSSITPQIRPLPLAITRRMVRPIADVRIALASPLSGRTVAAQGHPERRQINGMIPYRFTALTDAEEARAAHAEIDALLEQCAMDEVDLLILPELCLPPAQLDYLKQALRGRSLAYRPVLVIAGSWHVSHEGDTWINRSEMLDGRGRLLWAHDKCTAYDIPASQAEKMPTQTLQMLGIDARGGVEDIALGRQLTLWDGPWGRLTTLICKDFFAEDLRSLLVETQATLLLVPTMSERTEIFEQRARELGSLCRASSFISNSAWLLRTLGGTCGTPFTAFAYLPGKKTRQRAEGTSTWMVFTIRQLCRRA